MSRAKTAKRYDGRIETGHGGQAGDLGVADVERDHQGGQGDARRDLAGDVGQRDTLESHEWAWPSDLAEHVGSIFIHDANSLSTRTSHAGCCVAGVLNPRLRIGTSRRARTGMFMPHLPQRSCRPVWQTLALR